MGLGLAHHRIRRVKADRVVLGGCHNNNHGTMLRPTRRSTHKIDARPVLIAWSALDGFGVIWGDMYKRYACSRLQVTV
jgi:hypothetical protein